MESFSCFTFEKQKKKKSLYELDLPWEARIILVPVFPLTNPFVLWINFKA